MTKSYYLKSILTICTLCIVSATKGVSQNTTIVTDYLNIASLGIEENGGYENYENRRLSSGAVYALNAASGKSYAIKTGAIHLRTSGNSGIVSTQAGGKIKQISVQWYSDDDNRGKELQIYAKDIKSSAYKSQSDLYKTGTSQTGILIGSLKYSEGNKTIDVTGDYQYIGIRSKEGTIYLNEIAITWETEEESVKKNPELKFSATTATATIGEVFTAPTLSKAEGFTGVITYTSSNPQVADVDNAGNVSIKAAGKTTISATSQEDDVYSTGKASYELTVKAATTPEPSPEPEVGMYLYRKVTSQNDIVDGGMYLIVASGYNMAMGESNSKGDRRQAVDINVDENGYISTEVNKSNCPYEVTLKYTAKNTYQLQLENAAYLSYGTGGNNLVEDKSSSSAESKWRITISDNNFTIQNTKNKDYYIQYNYSANLFGSYQDSMFPITLYRRIGTFSIKTDEGYGTIFTDKAYEMPDGVEGTTVTGVDNNGHLLTPWDYQPTSTVPANTGLLLKGEKGNYTYNILNKDVTPSHTVNYMAGSTTDADIVSQDGMKYYKLTYSDRSGQKVLGFYWGAEEGKGFKNGANKAYLALPSTIAAQVKGFSFGTDDNITGITGVQEPTNGETTIYTLTGIRLKTNPSTLPKGLYIVNGQKTLIK